MPWSTISDRLNRASTRTADAVGKTRDPTSASDDDQPPSGRWVRSNQAMPSRTAGSFSGRSPALWKAHRQAQVHSVIGMSLVPTSERLIPQPPAGVCSPRSASRGFSISS